MSQVIVFYRISRRYNLEIVPSNKANVTNLCLCKTREQEKNNYLYNL